LSTPNTLQEYLHPSRFINSSHADILLRAGSLIDGLQNDLDKATALYYWVRDEVRYNPYALTPEPDAFLASATLHTGEGWCVPKALLLAALCRAAGIPARVGFADVRNHLSTERMRNTMQTDIFYFHGYTSIYLEEKWVKATPAFNIQLCEKFGLHPLEFNGREDSLYHEFDIAGNKHMEYLNDLGEYKDLPLEDMLTVFKQHYPGLLGLARTDETEALNAKDWDKDVAKEVKRN
jgi:transglutaminase-like putative cysteine protease